LSTQNGLIRLKIRASLEDEGSDVRINQQKTHNVFTKQLLGAVVLESSKNHRKPSLETLALQPREENGQQDLSCRFAVLLQ
jgi:hypothetical protein